MTSLQSVIDAPGDWYVVHTRSRQEKALAADLSAMRVPHYLPLADQVRYYGRRKQRATLPLFPSYLFLRGSLDEVYAADRTKRVARVLPVPDEARLERELVSLDRVLALGEGLMPHPFLEVGVWVQVKAGPFKGVQGMVQSWRSRDRLVLQVQTLGQASSLEIDGGLLEPLAGVSGVTAGRRCA